MKKVSAILTTAFFFITAATHAQTGSSQHGIAISNTNAATAQNGIKLYATAKQAADNPAPATKVNEQRTDIAGKIYFSDKPFANGGDITNAKTAFKAGDEIYGMVVMDKNFGEYNEDETKPFNVTFYADLSNISGDGSSANTALEAVIHPKYNKQNYLFFDISPAPAKAVTYAEYNFMRLGNLFATIKGNETYGDKPKLGNNRTYNIEFKIGYNLFAKNSIDIDYTTATKETMKTWMAREEAAFTAAKTNTNKANDNEASATAGNLPLPQSFLLPSANGYSDARLAKANIIAMIKKSDEVNDVLQFMFVKTTAQVDFEIYKTALGIPEYKLGNRFFQFIFKDKKGKCLAAGGRIKMNYEGGGKYGAPFVIWELPDIKPSEQYLKDADLNAYVVDCGKAKK